MIFILMLSSAVYSLLLFVGCTETSRSGPNSTLWDTTVNENAIISMSVVANQGFYSCVIVANLRLLPKGATRGCQCTPAENGLKPATQL
jgi:hypothetical protein